MTFSTLHALHAVIGTAIDDIERVYRQRSQGAPVEFPSLDEPHYRIRAPSPRPSSPAPRVSHLPAQELERLSAMPRVGKKVLRRENSNLKRVNRYTPCGEEVQEILNFPRKPRTLSRQWKVLKVGHSILLHMHPEIALIQHLVANGVGKTDAYIACSRPTCYASVVYTGTVNQVLKRRFTMDIDDPRWCQLYKADPWILPEDARPEVVAKMREHLLEDLDLRISAWIRQRWTDGFIAIGQGPDLDWEAE